MTGVQTCALPIFVGDGAVVDERLAGVCDDLLGADELVLAQPREGAVQVGVRAEFLHDGDVQTDALPIGGDPEGFGTDTQGQAGLTPGLCEDLTGQDFDIDCWTFVPR